MIIKKRALTNDPEHHLKGFGEAVTLTDKVSVAERYLKEVDLGVRVIKAAKKSLKLNCNEGADFFDKLRYTENNNKKVEVSFLLLPPTSYSMAIFQDVQEAQPIIR